MYMLSMHLFYLPRFHYLCALNKQRIIDNE